MHTEIEHKTIFTVRYQRWRQCTVSMRSLPDIVILWVPNITITFISALAPLFGGWWWEFVRQSSLSPEPPSRSGRVSLFLTNGTQRSHPNRTSQTDARLVWVMKIKAWRGNVGDGPAERCCCSATHQPTQNVLNCTLHSSTRFNYITARYHHDFLPDITLQ